MSEATHPLVVLPPTWMWAMKTFEIELTSQTPKAEVALMMETVTDAGIEDELTIYTTYC